MAGQLRLLKYIYMQFLNSKTPDFELTYSDVFLVPQKNSIKSRFLVDLTTNDKTGSTIPIVVSNMNAVAGKRMAETTARRGGLTVLPQDIPTENINKIVSYVKNCDPFLETPVFLGPKDNIARAMDLIYKRSHGSVIVVDENSRPVGVFTEKDSVGYDRFTKLEKVMSREVLSIINSQSTKKYFDFLTKNRLNVAPVLNDDGQLIGVVTKKGLIRSTIYKPNVDKEGRLKIAGAIGVNGKVDQRAVELVASGVDILVIDTAHGHQAKTLRAIEKVRSKLPETIIVAGNVATKVATNDLIDAGADIVKVGIGPGAMCTTRMMTGVGRPQFSAILECAEQAQAKGKQVWADGGIRHPRDVALALAAGASNVMFGSLLAGTYESAADTLVDSKGNLYKENFGMASRRAVKGRSEEKTEFERAKIELFEEGISTSKLYIKPNMPGVEDIIDHITMGLRSAMTYTGAENLSDFHSKAIVGVQSQAGFSEGLPVADSW
jgi:IMP dehydrogenase